MKTIGIVSGKGGVGKTTTAANLGTALAAEFDKNVILIDANFTTPDLGLHLGMFSFPNTFEDVLKKKCSATKAIYTHASGVDIISTSLSTDHIKIDARSVKRILKMFKGYELALIDCAPGVGKEVIPILKVCDDVLIITNPELPAITNSLKMIKVAKSASAHVRGVVLNEVRRKDYEVSVIEAKSIYEVPVIAVIPESEEVRESIFEMKPVVLGSPSSPAAIEFKKLAADLIKEEYTITPWGKLKGFLRHASGKCRKKIRKISAR